jgi:hypothetical protein
MFFARSDKEMDRIGPNRRQRSGGCGSLVEDI